MRVLIFEDEIPAYEKLLSFLKEQIPTYTLVAWCRSIKEASLVLQNDPTIDLIFSDIELLDGASFEIFEKYTVTCPIIFCTAFDQYLFKAFKTNGIAYLLKPYSKDNFIDALEKYKTLFENNESINPQVLDQLKSIIKVNQKSYRKRFSVKKKEGIKILATEDIVFFEASGDFCFAHDRSLQKHVINDSLGDVQSRINPSDFFRINRSQIINISFIENIEPYFKNKLAIKLSGFSKPVYTSGSRTPEFRKWIDM